jgi:hypothetical protein
MLVLGMNVPKQKLLPFYGSVPHVLFVDWLEMHIMRGLIRQGDIKVSRHSNGVVISPYIENKSSPVM